MYSEQDRNIFKYYDGESEVFGDPLALRAEIFILTNGNPNELTRKVFVDLNPSTPPEKLVEAYNAQKQLVQIARTVFKMKPYDEKTGKGATMEHCQMAWRMLMLYLNQEKKNTVKPQTVSPSSAGIPDSPTPTHSTSV